MNHVGASVLADIGARGSGPSQCTTIGLTARPPASPRAGGGPLVAARRSRTAAASTPTGSTVRRDRRGDAGSRCNRRRHRRCSRRRCRRCSRCCRRCSRRYHRCCSCCYRRRRSRRRRRCRTNRRSSRHRRSDRWSRRTSCCRSRRRSPSRHNPARLRTPCPRSSVRCRKAMAGASSSTTVRYRRSRRGRHRARSYTSVDRESRRYGRATRSTTPRGCPQGRSVRSWQRTSPPNRSRARS